MEIKAQATNFTRTHHIDGAVAPVFVLPDPPACSGGWGDGDVVTLPDGSHAYVYEDACGEIGLYREMLAMDEGDNVIRKRKAPKSTAGLAAPHLHHGSLALIGSDLVGWIR